METSLTYSTSATLFSAMLVMALVPSLSVMTVSARSAAFGFAHGVSTAIGVVAGDIVFILIVILGLAAIAESMEGLMLILKYGGGAYLVYLGIKLWRSKPKLQESEESPAESIASSFMAGFLLTLSDQKAILFYLVFFPAFVDLSKLTFVDAIIIVIIATLSVGGAKLAYAFMAEKASKLLTPKIHLAMNVLASLIMICVGARLILKS
jgi:threonine/homoserine/homoserine lactone efflux protein